MFETKAVITEIHMMYADTKKEVGKGPTNRVHYDGNLKYYELCYFLDGEYNINFGNDTYHTHSDIVEYLPMGIQDNKYSVDRLEHGHMIIIFFRADSELSKRPQFYNAKNNPKIKSLFMKLKNIVDKRDFNYYHKAFSIFYEIISELCIATSGYTSSDRIKKILPAVNYIHEHFAERDFDYKALPEMCNMGYTNFLEIFNSYTNSTPSAYITQLKISQAKELLSIDKYNISAISEMLGFDSMAYFCRIFKKITGYTPTQYRSKNWAVEV